MAKYVPPSKRAGYVPSAPPPDSVRGASHQSRNDRSGTGYGTSYNTIQLARHFTHDPGQSLTFFSYPSPFEPDRKRPAYDPARTPYNTPLPPSPPPPPPRHPLDGLVSFIRLFPGAHPAWSTHKELWVHTSADKLLADQAGEKLNFGRPIPVFEASRQHECGFLGYWIIDDLLVAPPHSDELKRMLTFKDEQHGYRRGRTAAAWRQALSETWVRVKMSPAPPKGEHYNSLKPIMDVAGGIDGEVEVYMLRLGGLEEQVQVLEDVKEERRIACEKAGMGRPA